MNTAEKNLIIEAKTLFLRKHTEIVRNARRRAKEGIRDALKGYVSEQSKTNAFFEEMTKNGYVGLHTNCDPKISQNDHEYQSLDKNVHVGSTSTVYEHKQPLDGLNLIRERRKNGVLRITIQQVQQMPLYDSWVPVLQDFFVTEDELEPFVPYYDDEKESTEYALGVYKQMLNDYKEISATACLSDGEIGENGELQPSMDPNFDSIANQRIRMAQRHTALKMMKRYGRTNLVLRALSSCFGATSMRRVKLINQVAENREKESETKQLASQSSKEYTDRIISHLLPSSAGKSKVSEENSGYLGSMNQFCFTCHIFACKLHEDEHVAPTIPIPDPNRDFRVKLIARRQVQHCSEQCFLREDYNEELEDQSMEWTDEQVSILKEALPVVGEDFCLLSIIIGEQSCIEVFRKLRDNTIAENAKNTSYEQNSESHSFQADRNLDANKSTTPVIQPKSDQRRNFAKKRKSARKIVDAHDQEESSESRYVPCSHKGACTKKNGCICMMNKLNCESQCGCNHGRFCGQRGKIVWTGTLEEGVRSDEVPTKCRNRIMGCKCKSGYCNTESCLCYENHRICNPDFCIDCGCSPLPSAISIHDRPCRNVDAITSRHKKILIGKSSIHGLGLFAGQHFMPGELVGAYCGRVMDTDLIDKTLRVSMAKKMTYAFNLTETLTIDAGRLGGKVKFINHNFKKKRLNCIARFERVRGEGRMLIKTQKSVSPGEEFFFDYQITAPDGNEWLLNEENEDEDDDDDDDDDRDNHEDSESDTSNKSPSSSYSDEFVS